MMWVDTYAPISVKDVVGQDKAVAQLKKVVEEKGIAFLHGPPGTGKTASVYALAHDLGYEILELNASDFRDEENVERIVGGSLQQASLFHRGKIVLVDELDGIAGMEDRGGIAALQRLLEKGSHAVVLIANDPWDKKFATLRKKGTLIEYRSLRPESMVKILKIICEKEGIVHQGAELLTLARRCAGDARAAITDLYVACIGKKELVREDLALLTEREQKSSVFMALQVILKGKDGGKALEILDTVDMDLDEWMLWLEENIGREYRGVDLRRGYEMLGKADVFRGRIRKWQYWRFLVYVRALMSAGVSVAKEQAYYGYTPYRRYERLLKIWMSNQQTKRRKDIASRIAPLIHMSTRDAMRYIIPSLKVIYQQGKDVGLPLEDEEREWLERDDLLKDR